MVLLLSGDGRAYVKFFFEDGTQGSVNAAFSEPRGGLVFIFPFAIETQWGFRRLTWLGSELCDYNGPLLSPRFSVVVGDDRFAVLWGEIDA